MDDSFAIQSVSQIKSYCSHFLKEFDLASFNYARYYADNGLVAVHTDPGYATLYKNLNCSPVPSIPNNYWQDSFYFLPKGGDDIRYNHLLEQSLIHFQADYPLYLINKTNAYLEFSVICTRPNDKFAINRYLNSLKDINLFIQEFRHHTQDLFQQGMSHKLYLTGDMAIPIPATFSAITKRDAITQFYRRLALIHRNISQREIDCLFYLCKGFRYKDIANELSISERTVETHIKNAKYKMNLETRSKLVRGLIRFMD